MNSIDEKIRLSEMYVRRIIEELLNDLCVYYINPYPIILILGAINRIAC